MNLARVKFQRAELETAVLDAESRARDVNDDPKAERPEHSERRAVDGAMGISSTSALSRPYIELRMNASFKDSGKL